MSTALSLIQYKDLKKKLSAKAATLPGAYIVEANNQSSIPWSILKNGITVKIPNFPEIQAGDEFRIVLNSSSGSGSHGESVFAVNNDDDIELAIALSSYFQIVGSNVEVYYLWKGINIPDEVSRYDFEEPYPLPIVEDADDGVIDPETAYKGIKIKIPAYDGMAVGDLVTLNYLGRSERGSSIQHTTVIEEDIRNRGLTLSVNGDVTGQSVPGDVTLNYSVISSAGENTSRPVNLKIESQVSSPQPDETYESGFGDPFILLRFIEHGGNLVAPVTVNVKDPIQVGSLLTVHVLSDRKYQSFTLHPETAPPTTVIRAYIPQRSLEALNGQTIIMAAILELPDGTVVTSPLKKWKVAEG